MSEVIFTDANFKELALSSAKPVLIDCYADWCGPCKMQSPIIDEVAKELGDTAVVGKLDIEANPETVKNYKIMSIPTLLVFKGGELIESMVGVHTKDSLVEKLKKLAA